MDHSMDSSPRSEVYPTTKAMGLIPSSAISYGAQPGSDSPINGFGTGNTVKTASIGHELADQHDNVFDSPTLPSEMRAQKRPRCGLHAPLVTESLDQAADMNEALPAAEESDSAASNESLVLPHGNARTKGKASGSINPSKDVRCVSDGPTSPSTKPRPAKRVRTSNASDTLQPSNSRRLPSFTGPALEPGPNPNFMFLSLYPIPPTKKLTIRPSLTPPRNFTATVYVIKLGTSGVQFHAHESVLLRSTKLTSEIAKARSKSRRAQQQILSLNPHDPDAFGQMLQYLYKDRFTLLPPSAPLARMRELHELMSLAKHYNLPGLQKQVVQGFQKSKILARITPSMFFDWAEDMWYEELDHEKGPFKGYFARVAPMLMRGVPASVVGELGGMVKQGGGFAEEILRAVFQALEMPGIAVKGEPVVKTQDESSQEQLSGDI